MKFSETWLREWIDPPISTQELSHQLTMAGLEVDAIQTVAPPFSKVVVGRVLQVEPHPNADKLRICSVDAGLEELLQIVCGAPNVRADMCVPTALIGAELPGGLKIKKAELRGVASQGMLCSAKELGLSSSSGGLWDLPADIKPGTDIRHYLKLDDYVFELGLTPNRGDCLSIAGIAREVAAINRLEIQVPAGAIIGPTIPDTFAVNVSAPHACPRYVGRIVRNINAQAVTPLWMQERLRRLGLRSIHPVVDVTNYVMIELGQPMHAFDLNQLAGGIEVRYANSGETLVLLDGQEVTLDDATLVIADKQRPLAMAGIMGGKASGVEEKTTDIFLESAFFSPQALAGCARRYGLHTDSSHRFERGVDPELQRHAIDRATQLLLQITGGEPGPIIDVTATPYIPARTSITLRNSRLDSLLGHKIPRSDVTDILERLGMQVMQQGNDWQAVPPSYRFDLKLEADLIEEVARIYGYDAIQGTLPRAVMQITEKPEQRLELSRIRELMIDEGYLEAITFSFVDPAIQRFFSEQLTEIPVVNPISSEMAVMRVSLWPALIQAVRYNSNRQQKRIRLFEIGNRYWSEQGNIREAKMLAGIVTGSAYDEQWGMAEKSTDFFDVKGNIENILQLTGEIHNFEFQALQCRALHPGQAASINYRDVEIGRIGVLHPQVQQSLDLSETMVMFELDLAAILERRLPAFEELSKFPALRRDLALVVDEKITAAQLQNCVRKVTGSLLQQLQLFDVYQGKGIDPGRKSIALGLTLQDTLRTLTDQDVESVIEKVIQQLNMELGAVLRE